MSKEDSASVKYFVRFLGNGVSRKKFFWDLLTFTWLIGKALKLLLTAMSHLCFKRRGECFLAFFAVIWLICDEFFLFLHISMIFFLDARISHHFIQISLNLFVFYLNLFWLSLMFSFFQESLKGKDNSRQVLLYRVVTQGKNWLQCSGLQGLANKGLGTHLGL